MKIGWSTDPSERVYRLQTGRASRLQIWAEVSGTKADESVYHNRFADAWVGGEWFARTPAPEAQIA
ncbi:GIY-YIG nuclease family protein [Sphingomonas parapaucimobilis]|uniref:GIY-YIG nuclease family protein n=1 Tax=Sphingomonas parapaucimobilis TaxID=28213 RepID=UPI00321A9586